MGHPTSMEAEQAVMITRARPSQHSLEPTVTSSLCSLQTIVVLI